MKIKVINGYMIPPHPHPEVEFTTDLNCRDYDWLVVFDEMRRQVKEELLACPRERTILTTWEPVSIKHYSRAYTRQFGHLLTNRPPEAEKHPHYHLGRGYFPWFTDRPVDEVYTYKLPPKTETISAVCSAKQMKHTKHNARFNLVSMLKEEIPELAWFGRGVRPLEKKYEALDAYKYHVTIENHIGDHHWTEKLADAFLCECLPFYAGDPKITEIFPKESIIPIPIDDPVEATRIIKTAIENGEYEKRREAILEAKKLILERYNFRGEILRVIEESENQEIKSCSKPQYIYSRHRLRIKSPWTALEDGWHHLLRGFK